MGASPLLHTRRRVDVPVEGRVLAVVACGLRVLVCVSAAAAGGGGGGARLLLYRNGGLMGSFTMAAEPLSVALTREHAVAATSHGLVVWGHGGGGAADKDKEAFAAVRRGRGAGASARALLKKRWPPRARQVRCRESILPRNCSRVLWAACVGFSSVASALRALSLTRSLLLRV